MSGAPANQNCPDCGRPASGYSIFGCDDGSWNAGMPDRAMADFKAMAREAAAFRWLAGNMGQMFDEQYQKTEWWIHLPQAPALLEAVEKAMESEAVR